jgi:hypothetical protein
MARRNAKQNREASPERRGDTLVFKPNIEPVDAMGWPKSFWSLLGRLDADFDVGERNERTSGRRRRT